MIETVFAATSVPAAEIAEFSTPAMIGGPWRCSR